jgi:hypothetical protein
MFGETLQDINPSPCLIEDWLNKKQTSIIQAQTRLENI